MIINLILFCAAFYVIWLGAGLIVNAVDRMAKTINASQFAVSFFVLGILTSIPEFSVGINAVAIGDPEIYIGNLIGGIIVIFLLVIPVLAIAGNGVKLTHQLNPQTLLLALMIIAAPSVFIADKTISLFEAIFLIVYYGVLFYVIEKRKGLFERVRDQLLDGKRHLLIEIVSLLAGVVLVFISSRIIVDKTLYFSQIFSLSPFIISLVLLSVGTNLPELSVALRSVALRKKEVAIGDYIGSAAANSLFIGILTIVNGGQASVIDHLSRPFLATIIGLGLFFYFSRSKNDISRREGLMLLMVYIGFLLMEIF